MSNEAGKEVTVTRSDMQLHLDATLLEIVGGQPVMTLWRHCRVHNCLESRVAKGRVGGGESDEVWPDDVLLRLKQASEEHVADVSYLWAKRSTLTREEVALVTNDRPKDTSGRAANQSGANVVVESEALGGAEDEESAVGLASVAVEMIAERPEAVLGDSLAVQQECTVDGSAVVSAGELPNLVGKQHQSWVDDEVHSRQHGADHSHDVGLARSGGRDEKELTALVLGTEEFHKRVELHSSE